MNVNQLNSTPHHITSMNSQTLSFDIPSFVDQTYKNYKRKQQKQRKKWKRNCESSVAPNVLKESRIKKEESRRMLWLSCNVSSFSFSCGILCFGIWDLGFVKKRTSPMAKCFTAFHLFLDQRRRRKNALTL